MNPRILLPFLPLLAACVEVQPTDPEAADAPVVEAAQPPPPPRPPPPPAGSLGTTTATLGPPGDPGIWIETPLVSEVTPGRVTYAGNGKSVNVELRPSGGEPGSGSQISLAAIRSLEAPLTGILELQVSSS